MQDQPGRGRPCPLSAEQQVEFKARLTAHPTPEEEVGTSRGEDIRRILQQEFGVLRKLSSVYYLLHSLGYSSLTPRPRHVQVDAARQELFRKRDMPKQLAVIRKAHSEKNSHASSKTKLDLVSKAR